MFGNAKNFLPSTVKASLSVMEIQVIYILSLFENLFSWAGKLSFCKLFFWNIVVIKTFHYFCSEMIFLFNYLKGGSIRRQS